MDLYDDALLYDLVHGVHRDDEIFEFFRDCARIYGTPVLELACGSGNILIPLAGSGIEIVGLDISDTMLAACRRKADAENVKISVKTGDIRRFDLDRQFPLIVIAGNSLQHLSGIDEISECFASVKRHLTPNGRLIVEVFNPYIPLLAREMGRRYHLGEYGEFELTEDVSYDPASQISHINWHFLHNRTGHEKTLTLTMRQFFPQEFDALFTMNGFRIEHKFGDFERSAFIGSSPMQIIIARQLSA